MKLIDTIAGWFRRLRQRSRDSKRKKRDRSLAKTSWEKINVIEFEGKVFIAYETIPIVCIDVIDSNIPEVIAQARKDYLSWKEKFEQ